MRAASTAYDVAQTLGWKCSLHSRRREAKKFYIAIAALTVAAVEMNFLGTNPIRALVLAGVVQEFSIPPLLLMMMAHDQQPPPHG